jgi:hypothetical protein
VDVVVRAGVGSGVGAAVGTGVGACVGASVGVGVGTGVGTVVGAAVVVGTEVVMGAVVDDATGVVVAMMSVVEIEVIGFPLFHGAQAGQSPPAEASHPSYASCMPSQPPKLSRELTPIAVAARQ